MAYRWMSEPIPVMNSAIVIDNGSANNAMSTCSDPTGNHLNIVTTWWRSSAGRESRLKNTATVMRNDPMVMNDASQPAFGSPKRRPRTMITNAPNNGNTGTSQR